MDASPVNVSADATDGEGGEAGCPSLVVNGDFAMGNFGFTNPGYTYEMLPIKIGAEGEYTVGPNPSTVSIYPDWLPLSPPGGGNMLIVNASPIASTSMWTEVIPVEPQTMYTLSFSMACMEHNCVSLPTLQASVNSTPVGSLLTATAPGGLWSEYRGTWFSGMSTTMATIEIVDTNLTAATNDVVVADIFFGACN